MSGFDPADIKDEAIKVAVHVARGTLDFAQWSTQMLDQFGKSVEPHLQKIWDRGQKNLESFRRSLAQGRGEFPSQDELNKTFAGGVANKGYKFYDMSSEDLQKVFGPKMAPLVAKVLAATSANTELKANATLALKALAYKGAGKDFKEGFVGVHANMLKKVFAGEAEFGGLKVKDFALAQTTGIDAEQAVVADVWMGRIFFGKDKLSDNQYLFIRHFVRQLADEWKVTPRQAQAGLWYGIKEAVEGPADIAFFPELMRKKLGQGYLDDLLQKHLDDPDFAPLREARDEEVKKALAGKRNAPFLDKLTFQDPKKSPLINGEPYAILTWANPHGKKYGKAYNEAQNKLLVRELKRLGYDPMPQMGHYGSPEPSLLVPGLSQKEAIDLSRAGGQDAFISHNGYVNVVDGTIARPTGVAFNTGAKDLFSEIKLGKNSEPIQYEMSYDWDGKQPIHPPLDLSPSEKLAAWQAMNPRVWKGKKLASVTAPAAFYAAAENEQDPEKKKRYLALAQITTVMAVGAVVPKEQVEIFIAAMRSKLGDVLNGGEIPKNLGDYGRRDYWESRLGKLDDLTWARMKQQADRSFGEKLDPLGKAFTGEGDKQYMNQAYLMQDADGKQFIDARVKHWEAQGLRPIKITDETTRQIADMLDVSAHELSVSSLKTMTAPEILAVHDLMQASKDAVQQISKFISETPGLVKEHQDILEDLMARHLSRFDAASLKMFEVRSESGRALRQFKMLGQQVDSPGFWVHQAAKKMGIKMSEVPAEIADNITHFMRHGEFPVGSKAAEQAASVQAKVVAKKAKIIESEAKKLERELLRTSQPKKPKAPKLGSADNDVTATIRARADAARAYFAGKSGTLFSGIEPEALVHAVNLGVELLHDGVVALEAFRTKIRERMGPASDQDLNDVYVKAGTEFKAARKARGSKRSPGAVGPDGKIVSPGGSQGPKTGLQEPRSVNLDRPTRSQRLEALDAGGLEKSPEAPELVGGTPEPVLESTRKPSEVKTSKEDKLPPEPAQGPGLRGKAGDANKFENVLPGLDPDQQAKLVHYVNGLAPNNRLKGWLNVWKAGLLTNPATHVINIKGNIAHQITVAARNNVATGLDVVFSAARATFDRSDKPWTQAYWDHRTRVFGLQQFGAQVKGTVEGAKKGWYYLTTGFDQDDILSGLKHENAHTGLTPVDVYADVVFRTLGAEDKVFRYAALRGSVAEQAMVQASKERLSGKAWRNRVHEIAVNPSVLGEEKAKEVLTRASEDAAFSVFQDQTQLNKTMGAVVRNHPFMEAIIPFRKTVASIATKGLVDYNPVGATLQIARLMKLGKLDQRKLTELTAGGALGAAAMYLGYRLAQEDKVTSSYPRNATERELWANENRKENAILWEGQWHDYGKIPGLGPMLSMGASMQSFEKEGNGTIASGLKGTLRGGKTILDQNFLTGTQQVLKAMDEPDKLGSIARNYGRSVVPSVVGAIARGIDPKSREVSEDDGFLGAKNAAKAAIPGLSQELPEKQTSLGFPVEREGGLTAELTGIGKSPTARTDVLVKELRRLNYVPLKPPKSGKYGDSDARRTADEYRIFAKVVGERTRLQLYDVIDSDEYKDAENDADRIELLRDAVSDTRAEAQDEEADDATSRGGTRLHDANEDSSTSHCARRTARA
jgi:Protein of unknown function (DUF3293).